MMKPGCGPTLLMSKCGGGSWMILCPLAVAVVVDAGATGCLGRHDGELDLLDRLGGVITNNTPPGFPALVSSGGGRWRVDGGRSGWNRVPSRRYVLSWRSIVRRGG